jgi:hypothetical protein
MASALQGARLSAYEEALRELGCSEVEDLGIVEDEDLQTIGMKVIVSGPAQALLLARLLDLLCVSKSLTIASCVTNTGDQALATAGSVAAPSKIAPDAEEQNDVNCSQQF